MFDYTTVALRKTVSDLKRIDFVFNVTVQIAYIFYLIYALAVGNGIALVNAILLTLTVVYTAFFLAVSIGSKRQLKRLGKRIYKYAKHLIRIFTLGAAIADICIEKAEVTPFAVLFVALMVVGFIMQILLEIIIAMLSARIEFFIEAIKADVGEITKPFVDLKNKVTFWKKDEREEDEPISKPRQLLDRMVGEKRAEDARQKQEEKDERRRKKAERKEQRRESISLWAKSRFSKKSKKTEQEQLPAKAASSPEEAPVSALPGKDQQ